MALQIRVSPDALRKSAVDIQEMMNQSEEIQQEIGALANRLNEAWDGAASDDMVDKLSDLAKVTAASIERLHDSSEFLNSVAQAFESIDNSEESPFIAVLDKKFMDRFHVLGPGGQLDFVSPIKLFSSSIRVVPEQLHEIAQDSNRVISRLEELSNRVGSINSELQNTWEGRAYIRFSDGFMDMQRTFAQIADSLGEFSHKISSIASRYEEIDNMLGN